ncbi:MAG: S8 family serine peptidase [Bdellovibrionaceae bacterium]|nr:S8 family serine peptidase [Pseudobdellovibrionaceae bacterium]
MINLFLAIFSAGLLATLPAHSVERAILSVKPHHKIQEKDLNLILDSTLILNRKNLWTNQEREILKSLKLSKFSKAWIVEVSTYADLLMLERKINQTGLPINLDDYELPIQNLNADWQSLQWGIKNTGQAQNLDLDPVQTFRVPGIAGEDIQGIQNKVGKLKRKVRVAVLDTGIDKSHPNLKGVLYRNEPECKQLAAFEACLMEDGKTREDCETQFMTSANPNLDPDHNGYPLDCSGWSILGNADNPTGILGRPDFGDDQGHGTHVAGIIAAQLDPQFLGVSGVSSNVEIIPIQVIGKNPSEPVKPLSTDINLDALSPVEKKQKWPKKSLGDLVARGLLYAFKSKADVVNLSLGWPAARDSELIRGLIAEMQNRGIIVVAAAGNDSTRALLRPCAYEGVICVGSHGPDGAISHFSNYGGGVDILAPGLNILSTFPMETRPVRFRKTWGFEFLSGTSQASPFVAGVVAEMIAQGIPRNEIYPRLMATTRLPKVNQGLFEGVPHLPNKLISLKANVEAKMTLAGNMDFAQAMNAKPAPVVLPTIKEKITLSWNSFDKKMKFNFTLKNFWEDINFSRVHVRARFKDGDKSYRPSVVSISGLPRSGNWEGGQKITVTVDAELFKTEAQRNLVASDLDLEVWVMVDGRLSKYFLQEFELVVPFTPTTQLPDVNRFPVRKFPEGRIEWNPVDEAHDFLTNKRDYILSAQGQKNTSFSLLTQDRSGAYQVLGNNVLTFEKSFDKLRSQYIVRMLQGNSTVYALGFLYEPEDDDSNELPSVYFSMFDSDFKLIEEFKYDSDKAVMPYQIYWMTVGAKKRPAWVGYGKDPSTKPSLIQLWENPAGNEELKIRFYYLDENNQLNTVDAGDEYEIIDVLEPSLEQKVRGIVPVLMAKNQGSEIKPSFVYDFVQAEVVNGNVQNLKKLDALSKNYRYRNLIETKVDKILNLDASQEEYAGTYWFNENGNREQRVTFIHFQNQKYLDQVLKPLNPLYDSALLVRASFLGSQRAGTFVLTNSEIQYHDLISGQTVGRSLERYTFYPDDFLTSVYMPITVVDSKNSNQKLPAIFTTESSEINRGVKIVVPIFAETEGAAQTKEKVIELMTPAKLRLETQRTSGCRPLNTPVFLGEKGYAFDYFCGDSILRIPIKL